MATLADGFQIKFKIFDKLIRKFIQIKVFLFINIADELFGYQQISAITLDSRDCKVDSGQFPAFFIMFAKYIQ